MDPSEIGRALEYSRRDAESLLRRELSRRFSTATATGQAGVIALTDLRLAIVLDREGIARERGLLRQGFRVVHFWSHEVLARTPEVLRSIRMLVGGQVR